jgi:hypothetical protein
MRIGHEMNLTGGYQWSYSNPLFRRPTSSSSTSWPRTRSAPAARGRALLEPRQEDREGHGDDLWPGNDYVDLVCLDFYDNGTYGYVVDEAAWKRLANKVEDGNPIGVYAWYNYAKARGKRFAVPEWGITDPKVSGVPTDRPVFIRKMHEFFSYVAARGDLVFESYYNYAYWEAISTSSTRCWRSTSSPRRPYQQLFGAR